ncbi:MAG: HEAT repeat domain-containing protein [Myxococcota bacterium]
MTRPVLDETFLRELSDRSPSETVGRLTELRAAIPTAGDPERLRALARAMPSRVAGRSAEVALALCEVAMALVGHGVRVPPDVAELEPWLRVQWLRVGVASGEPGVLESLDETTLRAVVRDWSLDGVLDPRALLRRLGRAEDPRLRGRALDELRAAMAVLAISASEVLDELAGRAEDDDPRLRARAISTMAEGWLQGLSPAAARLRDGRIEAALADLDPRVAKAAVGSAAALGRHDWLILRLLDPECPGSTRAAILGALGPLARDEDLEPVLEVAGAEPLRLGPALRRFVLQAHRHGVFLRQRHLPAILSQFDAHRAWTGEELVRVTHIVRHALIDHLAELPADDARWIRRADVLAASVSPGAVRVLAEQLGGTHTLAVAQALVEAAGRNSSYSDEVPLLGWLDAIPEAVVPVLRVKGGQQAQARLRAMVEDPWVGPTLRREALATLWALSRDRDELLRGLSTGLGPWDSGLLDEARVERRDRRIARLVVEAPWADLKAHAIEPLRRLKVLCESGDIEQLFGVESLFREIFLGYVRRALAGDFTIKRLAMPELEQLVFRYGRHLVADGRSVRRFVDHGPQTGRDLVLRFACDWLLEKPAPAVLVALLETIGRHAPSGPTLRMIEPLWRHGHREVRRAAIEAILEAGEGARGLELSICRLAEHDEPRILVQALGAVKVLGARWAEPVVLAALDHPQMGVKRAAAEALEEIASERAVPTLVRWLAHHDNASFRAELRRALARAAGISTVAVLVEALGYEAQSRRIELLWDALSGTLPLAAAIRLALSERASDRRLLEACLEGRVSLADADRDTLAAQLHRARLRSPPKDKDDPGWRLRVEGFSPEAAVELLQALEPKRRSAIVSTIAPALADWIAWLRSEPRLAQGQDAPTALALVLDASQAQHQEHVDALLALIERWRDDVDAGAVAGFMERRLVASGVPRVAQVRAIELLRSIPASAQLGGLRRHRLLGRLGAVRGRADLEQCLDECRLRPNGAGESTALLVEALQIPGRTKDEPEAITELRLQAERFSTRPEPERRAWLGSVLEERPLGLPDAWTMVEPLELPPKPRFVPASKEDLRRLLDELSTDDPAVRTRAAERLLDWPDSAEHWGAVLDALLRGRITLDDARHRARLAPLLSDWPLEPAMRERAEQIVSATTAWQQRVFHRAWVEAWEAGNADMEGRLRSLVTEALVPLVVERLERGDARLARFLPKGDSLAVRSILDRFGERFGDELAHLRARPPKPDAEPDAEPDDAEDPEDPIAGRGPDQLLALIDQKAVARGLAVRAVHALVEHGERAVAPLERLVTDRRPPVRSAALRALRKVAPRSVTMAATARVLGMETRRDVILQLMRSLGHGRHAPSLPGLIERLDHRDLRVRQTAHESIRAWGPEVVPALRRAWRRVRPDRRPALAELVAELEAAEDGA